MPSSHTHSRTHTTVLLLFLLLLLPQAPAVEEDHGVDAAQFLWQQVGGNRRLTAFVERRERLAAEMA